LRCTLKKIKFKLQKLEERLANKLIERQLRGQSVPIGIPQWGAAWNPNQSFVEYMELLADLDSLKYSQSLRSIAARVKNNVSLGSRIKTDEGSEMLLLCNITAHSVRKLYNYVKEMDISDEQKRKLTNAIAEVEGVPASLGVAITQNRKQK
jgi:hypothetical protein